MHRINVHHLALFNTEQCHLWLAFWCDLFGAIMVVATCLLSVGLKDQVESAAVGLAISNTIQVRGPVRWGCGVGGNSGFMWVSAGPPLLSALSQTRKPNPGSQTLPMPHPRSSHPQVLVFFTWVVRGAADTVSMWDAVERVATFCTNIPEELEIGTPPQGEVRCSLCLLWVAPSGGPAAASFGS